jgi:hypothetical protein
MLPKCKKQGALTSSSKKKRKTHPARKVAGSLRAAINVRALIEALELHVLGQKEMTPSQVTAALALLKTTLPDRTEDKKADAVLPAPGLTHEDALSDLE